MNLVFLIGCAEPGRSGVGDYTRLLAAEACRCGHRCAILAVEDPFVDQPVSAREGAVLVRRLRAGSLRNGSAVAVWRALHESLNPDWVSLQFVPFAFHPKGLVWPLLESLVREWVGVRRHVAFHEVWIGEHREAPWKERCLGRIQRWGIARLHQAFRPDVSHTSILLYQRMLAGIGWKVGLLPLFGNIPVGNRKAGDWLMPLLLNARKTSAPLAREGWWLGGIFGSIHDSFDSRCLCRGVVDGCRATGLAPACIWMGRQTVGASIWRAMREEFGNDITFLELGELSAERVSEVLRELDAGIVTTPSDIAGKSGAVATMLDHGLPALTPRMVNRYPQWLDAKDLERENLTHTVENYFSLSLKRAEARSLQGRGSLSRMAQAFMQSLETAGAPRK